MWTLPHRRVAAEDASHRKFVYYRYSPSLPRNYSRDSLYHLGEQQKAMPKLQVTNKMSNPLNGLKIEYWWHAFTVVGGAGMIACIPFKVDFISQRDSFLFFLGLFMFGVGSWVNHPYQETHIPGGKITSYHRQSSFFGLFLEVLGIFFFAIELYRITFTK